MTATETLGLWVSETLGLDGRLLGAGRLEHALATVMAQFGLLDAEACVARVRGGGAEREAVIEQIVTPETWFFRDREPFAFLRQVAREQWAAGPSGHDARVLSLACATGEEPYSIAITLAEAGLVPARFRVDAVDVCPRLFARAQRAVFGPHSFREALEPSEQRYFTATPEGRVVDARVAGRVRFMRGNVVGEMPPLGPARYHAVFCRNLMIYLSKTARDEVLSRVRRWLLPGGFLFVGHSELPVAAQAGFASVKRARVFACRREKAAHGFARNAARPLPRATSRRPARAPALPPDPGDGPQRTAEDAVRVRADGRERPTTTVESIRNLADAGATAEAGRLCEAHLRRHRTDVQAHYLMGILHQTANRDAQAEESFRRALYLDPEHYETLVHLSLLHQERGDGEKAELLRQRARRAFETRLAATRPAAT